MSAVKELFDAIKAKVAENPAKVANLTASYQFDLSGEGGGTYHATFSGGSYDIGEGPAANPGCTITMSAGDFVSMAGGKLNPTAAFMSGKLKLKGDMGMAMKLQSLIS